MLETFFHRWLRIPYSLHIHTNRRVKKPRATVLFIHGIGNSSEAWGKVIQKLPDDLRIITIDLLGFGRSPKPRWAIYDVRRQARSVMMTYIRLRLSGRVIIVGHSLGALVAIELAKRYPLVVASLVLCSPPFFNPDPLTTKFIPSTEKILKDIYRSLHKFPDQFVTISQLAVKFGIINKSFKVTSEDVHSYMGTLEASIVNQTSLQDATRLKLPIRILYGSLDPVIIIRNIKALDAVKENVTIRSIVIGHEVRRQYVPAVVNAIEDVASAPSAHPKG
jgi:pimeloyl-ACP methyl ester carboxylesterase